MCRHPKLVKEEKMKQYCRYCGHAVLQDDDLFYCEETKKLYNGAKAKRLNKCKHFGFCEIDLFDGEKTYAPREEYKHKTNSGQQLSIFDLGEAT